MGVSLYSISRLVMFCEVGTEVLHTLLFGFNSNCNSLALYSCPGFVLLWVCCSCILVLVPVLCL
jgi:hypothetical protein